MTASIIINNYNYSRFLRQAIDSALHQTYPETEVVVVDDGSTDESRQIIASYGSRIVPVLKENGGHGSTFNAGFAACRGEIVCFLDSDDTFLPNKVSRMVEAWRRDPSAVMIYHQFLAINAGGEVFGRAWPQSVVRGDIERRVVRSGGWWPHPTTSALCFHRSYLDRVLPMPDEAYRVAGEGYLAGLAPFLGPVAGIKEPLAFFRMHGNNGWNRHGTKNPGESRRFLNRLVFEVTQLERLLRVQFNHPTTLSLEDNFRYHLLRRLSGESVTKLKIMKAITRTPSLPASLKTRELLRVALNRA
jgi:glycosyltransferase involved in cell wall biosynthesis